MHEGGTISDRYNVFTVAEITRALRRSLETAYPSVWVSGEISDFRQPMSGHMYFNLKDENSQLRVVLFKGNSRRLRFTPADGMEVIAHGRISVYEPRGDCQLICDALETRGAGALQAAFEELKKRLEAEGLFAAERKRPLPVFPGRIGVVTSPSGAAVQDFIRTAARRHPGVDLLLAPVRVQGETAADEIAVAIERLNRIRSVDVIAVIRGGGGMEDLWPFNEERLVRAVSGSRVPVVSGVGHETDYTLCDFAADARALTPTDAARLCVPDAAELRGKVARLIGTAGSGLLHAARDRRLKVERLLMRLDRSRDLADEARRHVEESAQASKTAAIARIATLRRRVEELSARTAALHPRHTLSLSQAKCTELDRRGSTAVATLLRERRAALIENARLLHNLSPLSVLDRGYSLAFDPTGGIVRDASTLSVGDTLNVRFASGEAETEVKSTSNEGPEHRR